MSGSHQNRRRGLAAVLALLAGGGLTTAAIAAGASATTQPAEHVDPAKASRGLLIIVPAALRSGIDDYAKYRAKDLLTRVVELEAILKATPGVDDAEKLKRFLFNDWKANGIGYVLLVGDADVLPVRYMTLDRIDTAAFNYSFYPCDLYYGDLAKSDGSFDDWNAEKDGFHANYFGEVRGEFNKSDPINFDQVDFHPDIAVGRWPVSTAEAAARVAQKCIAFEARDVGRRPTASIFAVGGWVDMRKEMNANAKALTDWSVTKYLFGDEKHGGTAQPPSKENVVAALNAGADLVLHAGHGADDRWHESLDVASLKDVHNADKLAIVMSCGCSTARFATLPPYEAYRDVDGKDHTGTYKGEKFTAPPTPPACYQTGPFNWTGLGEQLVVGSENGAVAYIGCNTGSQPPGLTLMDGFVRSIGEGKTHRIGDAWNDAVNFYFDKEQLATIKPTEDWEPPAVFFQPMKFMIYADPSLKLPLGAATK